MLRKLMRILSANQILKGNFVATHLALLMPGNCQLCGIQHHEVLCPDCMQHFFAPQAQLSGHRCVVCALPVFSKTIHCGACIKKPPAFNATIVACDYGAPLDQLILSLKFGHRLAIAPALATLLRNAAHALPDYPLPDILIPVPLSKERLAQRGFNQALEITRPLARLLHLRHQSKLLLRVRDTAQQTRLHPNERHKNIQYAFSPNSRYKDKIHGLHIGVVDDVITTGATLHEVAACLKRHGAARITNYVFARTPPH